MGHRFNFIVRGFVLNYETPKEFYLIWLELGKYLLITYNNFIDNNKVLRWTSALIQK